MAERRIEGIGASPLAGIGPIHWLDSGVELPPETGDCDPATQRERYRAAKEAVDEALSAERDAVAERIGEDEAAVFDAHRQFLSDPEIEGGIEDRIDEGAAAEHAVDAAYGDGIERLAGMEGMMAERADDLRDIRDQLLETLVGEDDTAGAVPDGAVLAADRLTPSETARLDPDRIAGVVTRTGGRTAHASIIARSLGIPAVVGVGDALTSLDDGDRVLVDGDSSVVVIDPAAATASAATERETVPAIAERVETADGRALEVAANVGSAAEAERAATQGADGVGLFRTEFLFLDRSAPPSEDEQRAAYARAADAFDGEDRVIVRTLDVGGDKPVEYLDLDAETNGFLGARGVRLSLGEHGDLFDSQLRAVLRAAGSDSGASLSVMFPMVSTVEELDAAIDRLDAAADDLEDRGVAYARPEVGVMIETPAAAETAGLLASRVDFLSIGTNDLTGYVMAARRDVERVAALSDPLQPAVLRAIDRTVRLGHGAGAWVGMCGEMAGQPRLTALLVGLGLDELSASAVSVPRVKRRVRTVDTDGARDLAQRALAAATRSEVESLLADAGDE
jgi:phosphotransferase system enzyme I (PtsI)